MCLPDRASTHEIRLSMAGRAIAASFRCFASPLVCGPVETLAVSKPRVAAVVAV